MTGQTAHRCLRTPRSVLVNGIRFDPISCHQLVERVESFLSCGLSHSVMFLAADPTVRARRNSSYREVLNRSDLNVADGRPITWALRLAGGLGEHIPGTQGFALLCAWGVERSVAHYLYGGTPEVLSSLETRLRRSHPGIRLSGAEDPPFRDASPGELEEAAERISKAGTDLLWIGLGTPRQHLVAERLRELKAAPVILCVGAAFDFASGTKHRPPRWLQQLGLEWTYRLATEPRRLWRRYLLGNPQFVAGIVLDCLARVRREVVARLSGTNSRRFR